MGGKSRICEICGRRERHNPGFFSNFPTDEQRCRSWVQIVGNEDLVHIPIEKLCAGRFICGDHFTKKDFNKKGNRLKRRAYPKLELSRQPLTDYQLREFPAHVASKSGKSCTLEESQATPAITIDLPPEPTFKKQDAPETIDDNTTLIAAFDDTGGNGFGGCDNEVTEGSDKVCEDDEAGEGNEAIFSWQTTELIEADNPEERTAPPSPPADKHSLFCDPEPGPGPRPETAAEPDQAVPKQTVSYTVEERCNGCREINSGFEFWCVQCSCGAMCGACALRPPHDAHYVLRAPATATRTQTQAVLVLLRHELSTITLNESGDLSLKIEVKEETEDEPIEPVYKPTEEPCVDYRPSSECSARDPLACDLDESDSRVYESSDDELASHETPAKRRRLSDISSAVENSAEKEIGSKDVPAERQIESQDVQHGQCESQVVPDGVHLPRSLIVENRVDRGPQTKLYSNRKRSGVVQSSQPRSQFVKPKQIRRYRIQLEKVPNQPRISNTEQKCKESLVMQQNQKGSDITETSQLLKTSHVVPNQYGKPLKSIQFSHLNKAQIGLLSQLEGFKVVQYVPTKCRKNRSEVVQHSQTIQPLPQRPQANILSQIQHKRSDLPQLPRLKGSQAPAKVTSEGPPQTALIDLDDVGEEETVEYLEESLLESDPETVSLENDTQIELQDNDRETVVLGSDSETELQENSQTELQGNTQTIVQENTETELQENIETELQENTQTELQGNTQTIVQENIETELQENTETIIQRSDTVTVLRGRVLQGIRETLQESDIESFDDDVLDKDYRVDEEPDDSDESRTSLNLESLINRRMAKILAATEASRKNNKEKSPSVTETEISTARLPEAVVQLRPLTSLEIKNWTSDKKRRKD